MTKGLIILDDNKVKCPYCGNVWTPRVEHPKFCPFCRRTLLPASSKQQVTPLKLTVQDRLPSVVLCKYCSQIAVFKTPQGEDLCVEHTKEYLVTVHQPTAEELLNHVV